VNSYLVGGAVRDRLLGLDPKERDWVVVGESPESMVASGFTAVGQFFPVFLHPDTKEEYALARLERSTGPGYGDFEFHTAEDVSLEDDLKRRDLTINAIAQDNEGHLIDPYGGQVDLAHRLLRHVSPAFDEDPLRVLRLARFKAQLSPFNFTIAEDTLDRCRTIVHQGSLSALTQERIFIELNKALATPKPALFFQTLRDIGALPDLFPGWSTINFGVLDNFEPAEPLIRFARLAAEGEAEVASDLTFSQLGLPKEWAALAKLSNHFARLIAAPGPLDPGIVFDTLKSTDARRRPDRFTTLLLIASSIHNHGPSWTPLAKQWNRALEALLMPIETGSLGASSDRPAQIEAMQRSRIADAMIQSHSE